MILTLTQAAAFLHWKPRTLRQKIKEDPTIPHVKLGKAYRFIQADLEKWVERLYSAEIKELLEVPCPTAERVRRTSKSLLEDVDKVLGLPTTKGRRRSNTSSTTKRGTTKGLVSALQPGTKPA